MRIEISAKAAKQIDQIEAWWRSNRPYAPGMFQAELSAAMALVAANPGLARRFGRRPEVGRVLLVRTRYHLYVSGRDEMVTVISVWGAGRKTPPRLR